ncbi:polysaccharide deacetylase family protein [Microbacterium sp. M3]|uniref:Polysaccharide deacetylase family protein n=1 Tax=Microbacterium arthrosphaerae TaxID=792652 RepID=A0ABU4H2Q1_9MICO|nr:MULTISPECIES: polysaccharide deacetylase family protein [Microbacterium]MDW4573617.1 polysaccharide deacetylase family protein [Microbacterium arthrosphaerae]MDW7607472.1 polysaccharide deacetylase family protein [Microbacterium sp. M3]
MAQPGKHQTRPRARRRRVLAVVAGAVAVAAVIGGTVAAISFARAGADDTDRDAAPAASASPSATPAPTPLTPEEELLATASDPAACVVSFTGDGVADAPMLQTQGALYAGLPIPARDGLVFGGWYATPEDAAGLAIPGRVNGSEAVACTDQRVTLHAAWVSPEQNAAEDARIPILMYHQFTDRPEGLAPDHPEHWLKGNYAYIGDFDAHMNHIATTGFYLPTWDELSAFIDGRLFLPNHSVIVTDDDADQTWFDLAVPVVDKYKVLTTSFMITAYRQDPAPSTYVLRRSHTHDMHKAGANGDGMITNLGVPEIVADMEASAGVLGVKEVMAYPFGHYNDTAKEGLRQAGFEMARTIEPGYVTIGTDKLALPTVRINYGMGLDALVNLIG